MSPQGGGIGPTAQLDEASSLRAYLSEIRRFPRLTAREELELAQRIERNEPGARQQMITANLRLVVAVARRFADGRAPLLDLIQEGNTGLMRAVERFDWRHGFRFSSFAMQWVQQPIARAAAEADLPLRLPDYVHRKLATSRRIWDELRAELQRDPHDGEVARRVGLPTAELARLRRFAGRTISLDSATVDDGSSLTPPDAEPAPQPFDELRSRFLCADLNRALATLDVRERTILRLRFGLGGREPLRLIDVGNRLGLTAERIRQLQAQALDKLRRSSAARILDGYAAG